MKTEASGVSCATSGSRRTPCQDKCMQINWLAEANKLSDTELLTRVQGLAHREREATAALVASLSELDKRRLYLAEGCSSTFTFCTEILHLSEHAAYNRIVCARAARRFPIILDRLADGSVHLTAVRLLAPHMTAENHIEMLAAARHRGKRAVEVMVAALRPLPDVRTTIRRVPAVGTPAVDERSVSASDALVAAEPDESTTAPVVRPVMNSAVEGPVEFSVDSRVESSVSPSVPSCGGPPVPSAVLAPLSPGRYRVQFTAGQEMYDELQEARELLRHQIPDGDPARVMQQALKLLVKTLRARKHGAVARPRSQPPATSGPAQMKPGQPPTDPGPAPTHPAPTHVPSNTPRRIPTAVRRAVWNRDGARCAFRASNGHRCSAMGMLEFHHAEPFAVGGASSVENITLRCRAHNAHEARIIFGDPMPSQGQAPRAPQLE